MLNLLRKILVVFVCLLFSINIGLSQNKDSTFLSRNTFYLDVASKGAYYSLNYDRIFRQGDKLNYSFRIGFSILKDVVALPLGVNLFTGKKDNHLEFNITVMPYIDQYKSFLSKNDLSDKYLYVVSGIGYRYQKWGGGFFFKTALSPMLILDPRSSDFWKMDPEVKVAVNISAGWSF
ncbi:MAG: hypothetical protein ABFS35_06525 [Bacteroidota bacterium]